MAARRPLVRAGGLFRQLAVGDTIDFTLLSGLPTTLDGYGIADATPSSHVGSGGASHAVASTTTAGFMSPADKARLDSLSDGGGGVVLPLVTGEIVVGQPIFVILDDGSLVYSGVA